MLGIYIKPISKLINPMLSEIRYAIVQIEHDSYNV